MCAKGYRGTIAYSFFRHFINNYKSKLVVCQSSLEQINKEFQKNSMEGKNWIKIK